MKTRTIAALLAAAMLIPCLSFAQKSRISVNKRATNTNTRVWKASGTAGGVKYGMSGKINHDTWDSSQRSTVSFSSIPETLDDFLALQEKLGVEPQGAVALQVIAFEMYRRNKTVGTEAIRANNTSTNFNDCMRQLKEKMGNDQYYAQPYIVAALMVGATPENGYQPNKPYSISLRVNPAVKYQESQLLDGLVLYLQVDSKGWDTNWRGIEVVQPYGSNVYLVSNCPAFYTGCKRMRGTWTPID